MKFFKDWKSTLFFGSIILLVAFFIRFYNLTNLPIFGDEAIYIHWSQVMRAEPTLRFVPLSDGKQPLFMWVVIPFIKTFSDPLFSARMVSVLSGMGTLVGVFVLTQLLFCSKRVSLIAFLVYALSPFAVFFDRMALADSMLTFFGIWALIFSVITAKRARLDTAIIAGFFLGAALLTKSPAIFFVALVPATLLFTNWPGGWKEKLNKLSVFVFLFSFTYAVAYGMYSILRLGPNFHMISLRNKDYVFPLSRLFERPLDPLVPYLDRVKEYFLILGPWPIIFLVIGGLVLSLRKYFREVFFITILIILPVTAVAEFSKVMTARYIYFIVPYVTILASLGFVNLMLSKPTGGKPNHPSGVLGFHPWVFSVFLVLFISYSLFTDFKLLTNLERMPLPRSERSGYLEEWTAGFGVREISDYIRVQYEKNPQIKIVVGTEGYFGTLPDGLQVYLSSTPEVTVIGVDFREDKLPSSLVESKAFGNTTYLVVNNTRYIGNPERLGLVLISEYPKAVKPDGSREALLLFEVSD